MPRKTTTKATKTVTAKKPAAKKAPTKKVAATKAPAKKVAATKAAAPAKKVAVKKAAKANTTLAKAIPAQKAPSKKSTAKPAAETAIIARVDVGFGNSLYVRGSGAGLSWTEGTRLDNVSPYEWALNTANTNSEVTFKFLINDEVWAEGENLTVATGATSISSPSFSW